MNDPLLLFHTKSSKWLWACISPSIWIKEILILNDLLPLYFSEISHKNFRLASQSRVSVPSSSNSPSSKKTYPRIPDVEWPVNTNSPQDPWKSSLYLFSWLRVCISLWPLIRHQKESKDSEILLMTYFHCNSLRRQKPVKLYSETVKPESFQLIRNVHPCQTSSVRVHHKEKYGLKWKSGKGSTGR